MLEAAGVIVEAVRGLVAHLLALKQAPGGGSMRQRVAASVAQMEATDWLVPPMLQKRG